jgi:hypothetical protein
MTNSLPGLESVVWINLSQGRDQWRALVNTAINFWVRQRTGYAHVSDCQLIKKTPPDVVILS